MSFIAKQVPFAVAAPQAPAGRVVLSPSSWAQATQAAQRRPTATKQRQLPSWVPQPLWRAVPQAFRPVAAAPPATFVAYGAAPAKVDVPLEAEPRKRRLNFVSILQCVLVPWFLFAFLAAAMSFEIRHLRPKLVSALVAAGLVAVLVTGLMAVDAALRWRSGRAKGVVRDPTWFAFLCFLLALAWLGGVGLGECTYLSRMAPFYQMHGLNTYVDVNPARMRGEQVADGGRVFFEEAASLDIAKASGFKSDHTYCVVPITSEPMGQFHDFWAVGVDCCSGVGSDFECGASGDRTARGGLRLMDDNKRAYFRLAVQEAEAAFGIAAPHPLFFHWVHDPMEEVAQYREDAIHWYFAGVSSHLAFQCFIVTAATLFASSGDAGLLASDGAKGAGMDA